VIVPTANPPPRRSLHPETPREQHRTQTDPRSLRPDRPVTQLRGEQVQTRSQTCTGDREEEKGQGQEVGKGQKGAEETEKRVREESEKLGVQGDVVEVHGEKIDLRDVGQPGADVGGRG
jgi:hypothetical protein